MEALVVYFDALVKFKGVSVPHHLVNSFRDYCFKRGKILRGRTIYKEYQYFYID